MSTMDRLGLRTTGMQTYTEQQSDSHRPAEAQLGVKQLVMSHMWHVVLTPSMCDPIKPQHDVRIPIGGEIERE
jgi:hypothetical protein